MRREDTTIEGVQLIHNFLAKDERGLFVKTFNDDFFSKNGLQTTFKESYFSGFSILLDWKTGRVAELFRAGFLWVDR